MHSDKSWQVMQQTGKRAVLMRGEEQKLVQRPGTMTLKDFVAALPHHSMQSDAELEQKFPEVFVPTTANPESSEALHARQQS
jgi:hypothetical protein